MTPEDVERMRDFANRGFSRKATADRLGVKLHILDYHATQQKISFPRMAKAERARTVGPAMAADAWDRARARARAELDREIALARAERATAPPYKPPTDRNGWPV
jgi:hypothetical protein